MTTIRQKHRTTAEWQAILDRYEQSSLTSSAFCLAEGISKASLGRWRKLMGKTRRPTPASKVTPQPAFIDLGNLTAPAASKLDIRLDLGGGVVLHLVRS